MIPMLPDLQRSGSFCFLPLSSNSPNSMECGLQAESRRNEPREFRHTQQDAEAEFVSGHRSPSRNFAGLVPPPAVTPPAFVVFGENDDYATSQFPTRVNSSGGIGSRPGYIA